MKILRFVALLLIPLLGFASVTSQVDKSGPFLITGSPQTIPTGFPFVTSSELLVLDTGTTASPNDPATVLTLGSDYTVTGGGYNGANQMQTGSVIVVSSGTHSVATNDYIVIMRNVPVNQTSSFINTGPNTVLLLERMGDKLATISQQVNQIGSRSLRFENFEFLDGTLSKSARAGNLLGFDADGAVTYIPTSTTPGGYVLSITGTAHEITASQAQGAVTLSLPTALTFTGKTVTGGTFNMTAGSVTNLFGVGTTTPLYPVDVHTSEALLRLFDSDSGGGAMLLGSNNLSVAGSSQIYASGKIYLSADAVPVGFLSSDGLAISRATLTNPAIITGTVLHLTNADSVACVALLDSFAGNPVVVGRAAGGTSASPSATGSGSGLLLLAGRGYGTTAYASAATGVINIVAQENFTDSAQGTKIVFETTPTGSTTRAVALTIKGSGVVNLTTVTNYASNAAAISGGLVAGDVYRNGDNLCIVH